jgi:hypothetical protein
MHTCWSVLWMREWNMDTTMLPPTMLSLKGTGLGWLMR